MKKLIFIVLLCTCVSILAQGQSYPKNPNKTDAKGLRQGKWTILYNRDWKLTDTKGSVMYFRVIAYDNDKPKGIVRDYYKSGKVQMEGEISTDRPEEIMEGLVVWYNENGKKEVERLYKNGKQQKETYFNPDGTENIMCQETYKKGDEFYNKADYKNAVVYYEKALPLAEKEFGKESQKYATTLNNAGLCYKNIGLYAKAERLYTEAKNIREKVLGKNHPNYATSCSNLAYLYNYQGLYAKAEPLYIEAKNIREKVLGKQHPDYANSCNNLANLYYNQGLYAKAEPLFLEGNKALFSQIDNNFSNLSEKERTLFYQSFSSNFEKFDSFSLKRYKQNLAILAETYNNQLATKALLFNTSSKIKEQILNSKDQNLIDLYANWKAKRENLAKVYQMSLSDKEKKASTKHN